ncbi:antitoxin Xre/MbcA/ParS toxin-binding domain-containing protein [Delftia acidovorans]|uniref:antitoxin Xre/MbcA/ParS toxin-binding domain-containing protein n=1 Tax=Delftia acidovorans TaxID=80866 RepID=UPI00187777F6|nr:antitoxin Xre/MbcA/ParS toxin-binding domain-containing protein [Delftia acidovorans]
MVDEIAEKMNLSAKILISDLGIFTTKKDKKSSFLSKSDAEKILKLCTLIGRAKLIIEESGSSKEFNATTWLASWLYSSCPALGGESPAKLLDTLEGIDYLHLQIEGMQSSTYL